MSSFAFPPAALFLPFKGGVFPPPQLVPTIVTVSSKPSVSQFLLFFFSELHLSLSIVLVTHRWLANRPYLILVLSDDTLVFFFLRRFPFFLRRRIPLEDSLPVACHSTLKLDVFPSPPIGYFVPPRPFSLPGGYDPTFRPAPHLPLNDLCPCPPLVVPPPPFKGRDPRNFFPVESVLPPFFRFYMCSSQPHPFSVSSG